MHSIRTVKRPVSFAFVTLSIASLFGWPIAFLLSCVVALPSFLFFLFGGPDSPIVLWSGPAFYFTLGYIFPISGFVFAIGGITLASLVLRGISQVKSRLRPWMIVVICLHGAWLLLIGPLAIGIVVRQVLPS